MVSVAFGAPVIAVMLADAPTPVVWENAMTVIETANPVVANVALIAALVSLPLAWAFHISAVPLWPQVQLTRVQVRLALVHGRVLVDRRRPVTGDERDDRVAGHRGVDSLAVALVEPVAVADLSIVGAVPLAALIVIVVLGLTAAVPTPLLADAVNVNIPVAVGVPDSTPVVAFNDQTTRQSTRSHRERRSRVAGRGVRVHVGRADRPRQRRGVGRERRSGRRTRAERRGERHHPSVCRNRWEVVKGGPGCGTARRVTGVRRCYPTVMSLKFVA